MGIRRQKNLTLLYLFFSFLCIFLGISIFLTLLTSCQLLGTGLKKEDQTKSENSTIRGGDERDVEKELEKPATRLSLWIDNSIPLYLKMVIKNEVRKKFGSFSLAESQDSADVKVGLDFASKCYGSSEDSYQAPLILVPVVSFFTVCDGVAWEDFLKFWNGNPQSLSYITDQGGLPRLLIPEDIFNILEGVLGKCEGDVEILSQDSRDSLAYALNKEENSFSIIPFDWLEPGLKALNVDNMSVFDRKLNVREYPLALGIMVEGKNPDIVQELESNIGETGFSNRDIGELVTLNMTGVTALVRGTARKMEKYGVLYPAQDIAEILADADITHISNEIPFVEGCTGARDKDLVFCSKPDYIELIKYVGTDVIELTGNHMNDYGHEWMLYTLDLYDREGLAYFGGGRNLKESYKPAIFEISGNRIAFLGCNQFGPAYDWAGKETPGSTPPNYQDLENVVSDLKNKGYIVIFTFQYAETYDYRPIEQQVIDFRRMIEAGASIVSGSQSHHPMGVEITEDGFINYGLGNLFFDQMFSLGVRQGIIAKHVFYRQRHINTVLITTMLEDYCRPRLTTPEERAFLLRSIFEGSIRET